MEWTINSESINSSFGISATIGTSPGISRHQLHLIVKRRCQKLTNQYGRRHDVLVSLYCCDKLFWPKATQKKGFIWFTLPGPSPSFRKSGHTCWWFHTAFPPIKKPSQPKKESRDHGWHHLLADLCKQGHVSLAFLSKSGPFIQGISVSFNEAGRSTSTKNKDNPSQTRPQVSVMESIHQLKFSRLCQVDSWSGLRYIIKNLK